MKTAFFREAALDWLPGMTGSLLAVLCCLCLVKPVWAGVDGVFEMDGNANDSLAVEPEDDWDSIVPPSGPPYPNPALADAVVSTFNDGGRGGTLFTKGSKDADPIGDWDYRSGSVPPGNDFLNSYAAAYNNASGDLLLVCGVDRYQTNGNFAIGCWFFQDQVAASGGTFTGNHTDGDILITAEFGGSGFDLVRVFQWDSSAAGGPLVEASAGGLTNFQCSTVGVANTNFCGETNLSPITIPWESSANYKNQSNGQVVAGTFGEVIINVSQAFPQGASCFSSFMATSRASSEPNAELKEFEIGDFSLCSVAASKTCVNDSEANDTVGNISFNIRGCAINSGAGTVNFTSLSNMIGSGQATTPADLAWYQPPVGFDPATDCSDAVALQNAVSNGTFIADVTTTDVAPGAALVYQFTEVTALTQPSDTVTINAQGTDGTPINAGTASATCPQRLFNAGISVNKSCMADLEAQSGMVVVKIDVAGQVCNEGDVQLTNLALIDDPNMSTGVNVSLTPASTTLAPKGQTGECTTYTGYYYPDSIPTADTCPFTDQVSATAEADPNVTDPTSTGCAVAGSTIECSAVSNSPTCLLRAVDGDNDCATGPVNP